MPHWKVQNNNHSQVQSYNADCLTTTGDYRYRDSLSHLNVLPTVSPGSMNSLNAYSVSGTVASMPTAQMSRYSMSASNPLLGSEYYGYGGNEGSFEPYHLQSSPQEVTSSPTMYANTDQLRQWGPSVLQPGRGGITVYEENANAKTMHGLPSYIPVASPAVEGQSMFPGMSAMANSLPNSAGGDRVLPTPRLNYMSSNSSDPSMLAASQNYNTENSIPMKNDATWVDRGESLSMPARTESTAIATTQRPSLTRLDSRDGSAAYINNNQQLPAISAPQHQQRSETAASASEYSLAAATNAVSASTDEQQHNLSSPSYATSSYAYSLPSTSSRRPSGSGPSEATLLSGQTYTHLPHRPAPDPPLPRHHQYLGGFHNRGLGPVGANEVRNAASASAASSSRAPLGSVGSSYS